MSHVCHYPQGLNLPQLTPCSCTCDRDPLGDTAKAKQYLVLAHDPYPEDAPADSPPDRMRQDPLLRMWDAQEQLVAAQVELARLRADLAGFQRAGQFACLALVSSETRRMQETAALSARIVELSDQLLATHKQGMKLQFNSHMPNVGCTSFTPFVTSSLRPCPAQR